MAQYENAFLDAVDIMVQSAIEKAGYDKTIKATIVGCEDPTIGRYKINYQDSNFSAYSINPDLRFSKGTLVQILVPQGDMSQIKTILGAVNKSSLDTIVAETNKINYETYGKNCINSEAKSSLCSYIKNNLDGYDSKIILYQDDSETPINLIDFDADSAQTYIPKCNYMLCGAKIRTKLNEAQKIKGNYGIGYVLEFKAEGNSWEKTYILDSYNMSGDPYNYTTASEQYCVFAVDGTNFVRIKEIYIFTKNFPNISSIVTVDDIFFSNFEIYGANKLDEDKLKGSYLSFSTPNGLIFKESKIQNLDIIAQLRVKGEYAEDDTKIVGYYWFKQNNLITETSKLYNKYGGVGWECLNNYKEIATDSDKVEWIIGDNQITINENSFKLSTNKFKCVALCLDDDTISNTIDLYREYNENTIHYIESIFTGSGNISYHYGDDTDNVIVSIKDQDKNAYPVGNFDLYWAVEDNNGMTKLLEESDGEYNSISINVGEIIDQSVYSCTLIHKEDNQYWGTCNLTLYSMDYTGEMFSKSIFSLKNITKEQNQNIETVTTQYSTLSGDINSISMNIGQIWTTTNNQYNMLSNDYARVSSQYTNLSLSYNNLSINVGKLQNGTINSIVTSTMTFDDNGLRVTNSAQSTYTIMSPNGFHIQKSLNSDPILSVYTNGGLGKMDADNIKIDKYMQIGTHSQIQDAVLNINNNSINVTGVFWLG